MKETIFIENFGGLKKISFDLKDINLFIGPQASGKSVIAKLLFFFKSFTNEILKSVSNNKSKREFDKGVKNKFITYFPKNAWLNGDFKIKYTIDNSYIAVERKGNKVLNLSYSDAFKNLFIKGKKNFKEAQKKIEQDPNRFELTWNAQEKFYENLKNQMPVEVGYAQIFVPAGRSFLANIQLSMFSFLSNNKSIDPFLVEFGGIYERFLRPSYGANLEENGKSGDRFEQLVNQVIHGKFISEKDKDFIVHKDKRKVNILNASSGQQETLPLVLILQYLHEVSLHISTGITLYIEEPEAHLFPTAQKKIVQLLARTFNSKSNKFQIIVTTHSPYLLSSFNNLLEAGKIIKEQPNKAAKVNKVVPKEEILYPGDIAAYSVFAGKKKGLIDKETKLISQNILDSVSDEIAEDFGKLLDIEY